MPRVETSPEWCKSVQGTAVGSEKGKYGRNRAIMEMARGQFDQ